MSDVDRYIQEVIKVGDEGSALLAAKCAPTLRNSDCVEVLREGMNGLAVLRIPENYMVVVHAASGDPNLLDAAKHTTSLIDKLYEQARCIGMRPLGMADVIDASTGYKETVEAIADSLANGANKYEFAVMNGELAILGNRINCDANVSGTMVSITDKYEDDDDGKIGYFPDGSRFAIFNPRGLAVYMNSDGVGTKTEFYERAKRYPLTLRDSLAMKLDDASKIGARAKVVYDIVETSGRIPVEELHKEAESLGEKMGFAYLLRHAPAGLRLCRWGRDPVFNVSGSAVSVIDEERLRNPLRPREGNYMIAIRGKPNPRSNGITDKRKAMILRMGADWHKTREGKMFLEFLAEPSTVFYPVFSKLVDKGSATSVYHMSGGAYNGKLARPLAREGLYCALDDLYKPDWRELALGGFAFTPAEVAYAKWPMGNEGFVTTGDPERAITIINRYGLEANQVGVVERRADGKTGVALLGIKGSDGKDVYFSGK